ncbi:MAG TPA: hypothetical protein VLX44_09560 [Xanthobacteraceae bacterium]|nr:hypothetical protein [Xanthobacteraceae bacterium]
MSYRRLCNILFGLATALLAGAVAARAAEGYLGTWKIASAVVAPWADPARKPDEAEMKSVVGKTVTFKPKEIAGPRALACKGPKYKLGDFSADMLFQGAFGEMHDKDKSLDPAKLAASAGFAGTSWKVLETGCATEVDWHFIDPTTLAIGLNDYVYVLKKQ